MQTFQADKKLGLIFTNMEDVLILSASMSPLYKHNIHEFTRT